MEARRPVDEEDRLLDLYQYPLLGLPGNAIFSDVTRLAAEVCGTANACISVLDKDHEWILASHEEMEYAYPRKDSFCAHAILEHDEIMIVEDARRDPRFADNPHVRAGNIRFYAGVPLTTPQGHALGMLCVVDPSPHRLEPWQRQALRTLARHVMQLIEFQHTLSEAHDQHNKIKEIASRLQVEESDRMDVLRAAFHDLSSPLTVLRTQIALLESTLGEENETVTKRLALIKKSLHRVTRLASDIHTNLKSEHSPLGVHIKTLDLETLLDETTAGFTEVAKEHQVRLTRSIDSGLEVRGDQDRIDQIVSNLLSNAIKFTPPDGQIHVEAQRRETDVLVKVTDTGCGLTPREIDLAFQPFVQIKARQAQSSAGSGLGLAIARRLVEAQGGTIWAKSEGKGKGCTFAFTLPRPPTTKQAHNRGNPLEHAA